MRILSPRLGADADRGARWGRASTIVSSRLRATAVSLSRSDSHLVLHPLSLSLHALTKLTRRTARTRASFCFHHDAHIHHSRHIYMFSNSVASLCEVQIRELPQSGHGLGHTAALFERMLHHHAHCHLVEDLVIHVSELVHNIICRAIYAVHTIVRALALVLLGHAQTANPQSAFWSYSRFYQQAASMHVAFSSSVL